MEIETNGNWKITSDKECYILMHKQKNIFYNTFFTVVDGVFYDYNTAMKAMNICKNDKPLWDFDIVKNRIILDINNNEQTNN